MQMLPSLGSILEGVLPSQGTMPTVAPPAVPDAGVPGAPVVVGGGTPLPEPAAGPSTLAGLMDTPAPHAPAAGPAVGAPAGPATGGPAPGGSMTMPGAPSTGLPGSTGSPILPSLSTATPLPQAAFWQGSQPVAGGSTTGSSTASSPQPYVAGRQVPTSPPTSTAPSSMPSSPTIVRDAVASVVRQVAAPAQASAPSMPQAAAPSVTAAPSRGDLAATASASSARPQTSAPPAMAANATATAATANAATTTAPASPRAGMAGAANPLQPAPANPQTLAQAGADARAATAGRPLAALQESLAPFAMSSLQAGRTFGLPDWAQPLAVGQGPGAQALDGDEAWLRGVNASVADALRPLTMAAAQRQASLLPDGGWLTSSTLAGMGGAMAGGLAAAGHSAPAALAAQTAQAAQAAAQQAAGPNGARDTVAVPTQLHALQTDPMRFGRHLQADDEDGDAWHDHPRTGWLADEDEAGDDGEAFADEAEALLDEDIADADLPELTAAHPSGTAGNALAAGAAPAYAHLAATLAQAGQHAALRELELGRRVLLLMPAPGESLQARVHLLGVDRTSVGQVQSFGARWSPGPWAQAASGPSTWSHWRLHQEAGRGLWPVLQTAPSARGQGARACVLRLGAQPATLQDARIACLDIADATRFMRMLGPQWSLMVVLAPEARA